MATPKRSGGDPAGSPVKGANPPKKAPKSISTEKSPPSYTSIDEQCATNPIVKKIYEALNEIIDPEIGIGIADLGLIYDVKLTKRHATITMTLTSMGCPVGPMIVEQIETLVPQMVASDIDHADTHIVWDPPWSPEKMKPEVRDMVFNF